MRLRSLLLVVPVFAAAGVGMFADRLIGANGGKQDGDPKPAMRLPVTQVVMFNSGVGYFARSDEVEGDARVDLAFPETDINDLIKSMTLQDFNGGKIGGVSYDSREPVSRTLARYALNLSSQPSLYAILTHARGEKVEVTMQSGNLTPAGTNAAAEAAAAFIRPRIGTRPPVRYPNLSPSGRGALTLPSSPSRWSRSGRSRAGCCRC